MGKTIPINFESLCLANFLFTKHLIAALIGSGKFSGEQMQAIFDATEKEFHRTTLSVGPEEAHQLLALIWRDYVPAGVEPEKH